jgi:hypothetical protein
MMIARFGALFRTGVGGEALLAESGDDERDQLDLFQAVGADEEMFLDGGRFGFRQFAQSVSFDLVLGEMRSGHLLFFSARDGVLGCGKFTGD